MTATECLRAFLDRWGEHFENAQHSVNGADLVEWVAEWLPSVFAAVEETPATKTPWETVVIEHSSYKGRMVQLIHQGRAALILQHDGSEEGLANEELVKRAVNERAELIAALRDILPRTHTEHDLECPADVGSMQYDPSRCNGCAHARARAALAAAEAGKAVTS